MSGSNDRDASQSEKLSRRNMLKLSAGAAGLTLLRRRAEALPLPAHALQASNRCSSSLGTRPDPLHQKHGR